MSRELITDLSAAVGDYWNSVEAELMTVPGVKYVTRHLEEERRWGPEVWLVYALGEEHFAAKVYEAGDDGGEWTFEGWVFDLVEVEVTTKVWTEGAGK